MKVTKADWQINSKSIDHNELTYKYIPKDHHSGTYVDVDITFDIGLFKKGSTKIKIDKFPCKQLKLPVINFKVVKPIGDPRLSFDGTNATANESNERFFSDDPNGVLEIECEALPIPDDEKVRGIVEDNKLRWSIDSVGGANYSWDSSWTTDSRYGEGLKCKAVVSGLPSSNDDFGLKMVQTEFLIDGEVTKLKSKTYIEIFFSKYEKNNPEGVYPNWFYYWNKVLGSEKFKYVYLEGAAARTPAMRLWKQDMTYSKKEIWFGDISSGMHSKPYYGGIVITGIDCFVDMIRHESVHVKQIPQADEVFGDLNGKVGTVWEKGWSFNTFVIAPLYDNHWTLGGDLKPGKANYDDDGDGFTDEANDFSEIGYPGTDDVDRDNDNNDTPNKYEGLNPPWIEKQAHAAETVKENEFMNYDWGYPGKQSRVIGDFNDEYPK